MGGANYSSSGQVDHFDRFILRQFVMVTIIVIKGGKCVVVSEFS